MTPISNSIPQDPSSSNRRVNRKGAAIPVDFFTKQSIMGVRWRFGDIAVLAIIDVILQITRSENAEIDIDGGWGIIHSFKIPDPKALLSYCLDRGIFIKVGARIARGI